MIEYILGGKTIKVPEDKVDDFLSKYPEAKIKEAIGFDLLDPNFQEDTVESADAVSEETPAQEDTVSVSEDTSLDLPSGETFKIDGEVVTKEEFDDYTKKQEENDWDFWKQTSTEIKANTVDALGKLARIPTFLNEVKSSINRQFLSDDERARYDALDPIVKQAIGNISPGIGLTDLANSGLKNYENSVKKADKIREDLVEFDNTIGEEYAKGNFVEATVRTASAALGSIPSVIQSMIPYVGIASIVAGEAAGASGEVQKDGEDLSLKSIGYSTIIGASEGLLEVVTKKIGSNMFKSLLNKPKQEVVKSIKQIALGIAKDYGSEGLSESATLTINKAADALILKKENSFNGYVSELVDTFLIGGAMGGGMTSVGSGASILRNTVQAKSVKKELNKTYYKNLLDAYSFPNVPDGLVDLSLNDNTEKFLNNELKNSVLKGDITLEESAYIRSNFDKTRQASLMLSRSPISKKNYSKAAELLVEKKTIADRVKTINDPSLTSYESKRIDDINTEVSEIATKDMLTKTTKSVEGIVEGLEGISIKNLPNQEAVDKFKKENNIPISETKDAIEQGFIYQNPTTGEQTIVINEDASKKTYAVNVAAHEFLHGLIYQTVKNSPESAISLGESLNEYINKIDKDQVKDSAFKKRLESYKKMDEATQSEEVLTLFSDALATGDISFNENVFTKIGDVIRRTMQKLGVNIKFNSGKDVYKFIKDYNKSIEKGKLTKSQAKLAKGKAKGFLVSDEVSKAETTSKKSLASLQEQLDNLDEFDFDFDVFAFEAAKTNLKKKIELAKKKEAEPKKETKDKPKKKVNEKLIGDQFKEMVPEKTTNAEYKSKIAPKVIRKIEDDRMLFPLVKKIAAGYNIVADNVYGKSWDDFYDAVIGVQLKKNILNFKPETNDDLGGYIVGGQAGVRNRVKEALEKFKKEESKATEDISQAADITAEEKTSKQEVRKKYTSIINSNVVPSFTTKAITEKLTGIINSLKSKITDKAGNNAASTPLIKEIKSKVGKVVGDKTAIPKLIRERMGKFTKDQKTYEQFLIKNKKAILENMTTTWLMTAIPNAVEKSVGGKYTGEFDIVNIAGQEAKYEVFKPNYVPYSKWKGAKIDREGGAKRGITSGNELTRRVPANRISDQDFVDALIIKGDNKKTQSKFESLSKALAEELSFEIISRELKNPNSGITQAFKENQNALGVMIKDNIAQEFNRQSERGLVKFSLTSKADARVADFLSIEGPNSVNAKKIAKASGLTTNNYNDFIDEISISTINILKSITDREIAFQENQIDYFKNIDDYEKAYSGIKFSISKQEAYKNTLKKKRPDLDKNQIESSVQSVFDFAKNPNIQDKKRSKLEKLAFHYMANGFVILPEDGYKVIEAERIATAKKIDAFSFKNPNELIEKYAGQVKKTRINPDNVKEFTNKKEFPNGVVTYDVQNSKKGQLAVREVIDTNWGKKSNPWCLAARDNRIEQKYAEFNNMGEANRYADELRKQGFEVEISTIQTSGTIEVYGDFMVEPGDARELDDAFERWKNYNKEGNGFKISFKDGKLLSFRDGNKKQWWDRMDKPSNDLVYEVKEKGVDDTGLQTEGKYNVNARTGSREIVELYTYRNLAGKKKGDYTLQETESQTEDDQVSYNQEIITEFKNNKTVNRKLTRTPMSKDKNVAFDINDIANHGHTGKPIKLINTNELFGVDFVMLNLEEQTYEFNEVYYESDPEFLTLEINTGQLSLDIGTYDRNGNLKNKSLGEATVVRGIKKDGSYGLFTIDGVDVLASPTEIDLTNYIKAKESGTVDAGIKFSRIGNILNVEGTDVTFNNPKNVEKAKKAFLKSLKVLAKEVDGVDKAIDIMLPTISAGWKRKNQAIIHSEDVGDGITEQRIWKDKNGKTKYVTASFIFTGRKNFFDYLKNNKINVDYIDGTREYKINGNTIKIKSTPPQTAYNFTNWDKTKWTLSKRQDYAIKQREGAFQYFETLKKQYEKGEISRTDLAMILNSFNSSIRGLIRTAAIPSYFYKVKGLDVEKDYRYEHTIPAIEILKEVAKYITQENYTKSLDNIFKNYKVAIIPIKHDKILDKYYRSTMPEDNVFYNEDKYAKNDTYVVRYDQKDYKAGLKKAGLKPIKLTKFSLSQNLKDYNSSVNESIKFAKSRNNQLPIGLRLSGSFSAEAVDKAVNTYQEAINNAVKYSYAQNPKGISVWDFDDTLARTKSNVLYTMPDGTKGKLDAAEFAARSESLADMGAEFDFSEFSKVMKGEKGPMFDKAIKRNKKFGNKNVYILTARPANSKYAIHDFLRGIGLDVRLENIVGLADGNPQAKANWMIGKVAEGYNDFYFADDHIGNVKAVREALEEFDIKGKVQQAKVKFSKSEYNTNKDPYSFVNYKTVPKEIVNSKSYRKWIKSLKGMKLFHGSTTDPNKISELGTNHSLNWFIVGGNNNQKAVELAKDVEREFDGEPENSVLSIDASELSGRILPDADFIETNWSDTMSIAEQESLTNEIKALEDKYKTFTRVQPMIKKPKMYAEFLDIITKYNPMSGFSDKMFDKNGKLNTGTAVVIVGGLKPNQLKVESISDPTIKFSKSFLRRNKAVKDVLDNFDVKGKVQQAKIKFSMSLDKEFNDMLERNKGVSSAKEFSPVVAKRMARNKGMFKFWMPASLDDFRGLTQYVFAGKGKQGEADQKFFQDALITPYFRGIKAIEDSRQTFKEDFKALNRAYKPVLKKLGKLIPNGDYTYDQAIRVALWKKSGYDIPGLSKKDEKNLVDFVDSQADLTEYVLLLQRISKRPKWAKPEAFWDSQTILSDLNNMTEKGGRKEYISEFIENVDIIFSEKNLLKIKALYGEAQVSALKDIIWRMKNGTNRTSGMNKNVNRFNTWVNNSIGAIMFFNRRSALLQTLSTVNFINWSDNNIIKAGAAFANQPQFWKDFAMIFNSAKLKQRRAGLKSDVNEAEIASAVKGSKNKATAALSYLLKKGFLPTQMVDSFAIASGGATFYRNRVNTYLKQGMELAAAEKQAFEDFSQISEETQQSGDPALISSDQASALGRLLLAFQNTPIQLNRSIKKAALDIKNRRRSPGQTMVQSDFSNLSKIIYYGAIQNIIFSALQNALFALIPGFGDDDDELTEEEQKEKYGKVVSTKQARIINGISDTLLKGGFGVPGAFISTAKNMYMEYNKQEKKEFLADHTYTILAGANLAPPVGSKLRKIYSAIQTNKFEKDVIKERGWDVTIDGRFNLSPSYRVLGSFTEGATNLPLDRMVSEVNAITEALDSRNTTWQRLALAMGWKTWDVSAKNEEHDLIKTKAKAVRKKEGIEKSKKTRAASAKIKKEEDRNIKTFYRNLPDDERSVFRKLNREGRIKYMNKNK